MSFDMSLASKYGFQAKEIMRQHFSRDKAVSAIALITKNILLKKKGTLRLNLTEELHVLALLYTLDRMIWIFFERYPT